MMLSSQTIAPEIIMLVGYIIVIPTKKRNHIHIPILVQLYHAYPVIHPHLVRNISLKNNHQLDFKCFLRLPQRQGSWDSRPGSGPPISLAQWGQSMSWTPHPIHHPGENPP